MKRILETERLILREYVQADFDGLYAILSDAETMQHYPKPYDARGTQRWLDWSLDNYQRYGFGLWAIELKATGEFIGDCGITMQNIDGESLPEIGYHVNKAHWRKGYAKETIEAIVEYGRNTLNLKQIWANIAADNIASIALFESCGFSKCAHRKEWINRGGEFIDEVEYQLIF